MKWLIYLVLFGICYDKNVINKYIIMWKYIRARRKQKERERKLEIILVADIKKIHNDVTKYLYKYLKVIFNNKFSDK